MNKDQSYGGLIFAVSAIVFIVYLISLTDVTWRQYAIGYSFRAFLVTTAVIAAAPSLSLLFGATR